MTYRELQTALRALKEQGLTTVALNSTKEVLEAEYNRLTAMDCTPTLVVQSFWVEVAKYLDLASTEGGKIKTQVDHALGEGKRLSLAFLDGFKCLALHDAYLDLKSNKAS